MPKATNAVRLAEAIAKIKSSVESHIIKVASLDIRNAFCVIMSTRPDVLPPTQEMLERLKSEVLKKFEHEKLFGLAIQYFIPPVFLSPKKADAFDYEIRVGIASFDEGWQVDEFAKGMLYCPSEREINKWHARYARQEQSLRFTPLLDSVIKDLQARGYIRQFLDQLGKPCFDNFAKEYVKTDDNIQHGERKGDIRILYHELRDFPSSEAPLFFVYREAQEFANRSQNHKIKTLLRGFLKVVDARCQKIATDIGAPKATIDEILESLRGHDSVPTKRPYEAQRPALGLHYFRVAQLLMLFVLEFLQDPDNRFSSGEIALFIWLCQHTAFDFPHLGVKITDLLDLTCDQFSSRKNCVHIKEKEVSLTEGLGELFVALLGKKLRVNGRKLFTKLSSDFLADNFRRVMPQLPQFERDLRPSDLLITPHVLSNDAYVDRNIRRHLNWQIDFVKKSPYADTEALTKQIRETVAASLCKSNK